MELQPNRIACAGFLWLCAMLLAPAALWAAPCTHVKIETASTPLKIRPEPNTSKAEIGSAPKGTCLKVLQTEANGQSVSGNKTWYKIDYNGTVGWVSGFYAKCSDCGGPPPECTDGKTRDCYTGDAATRKKGECKDGKETCKGGKWDGKCAGETKPKAEVCDGKDNNCDGTTDEGDPGAGKDCTIDPPGTCDKGISACENGKITCKAKPNNQLELCDNKDNNCDGKIDNDVTRRKCYTGPANTNGVGICSGGEQSCKEGQWGVCEGELTPQTELCGNQKDDDCNGKVDDCKDPPPPGKDCVDNDKDSYGVGKDCKQPLDCNDDDPKVYPTAPEICGNGIDEDCSGLDLPCGKLQMGSKGCKKPSECETNFCVKLGEEQRCSQACKQTKDCPSGYTCMQGAACWPTNAIRTCKSDEQCTPGFKCTQGKCLKVSGCGCQLDPDSSGSGPFTSILWICLIAAWLFRLRLR